MPFVHVMMEPRDDETRHRITREVSDAVAEATGNSLDGVNVIFHELPRPSYGRGLTLASRRPRPAGPPVRGEYVTVTRVQITDQKAYLAFRRDHVNPALARHDGFVSSQILRLHGADPEYWILDKWLSAARAAAWLDSEPAKALEAEARTHGYRLLSQGGADFVHQTFGPTGGVVLDSPPGPRR
jgi:phenylpyruvate tautomerase PptA (4-oxalocrotonate tautomerase family)/heme-degrading monooxygenase HmoA